MEFKEQNMKKGEGNNEEEGKAASRYLKSERDMFKSSERSDTLISEAISAMFWETAAWVLITIYRTFKSQI